MSVDETTLDDLVAQAWAARANAYAPYSGFDVGAAVLTPDGRVFRGANVENASYPVGTCAERVAINAAVASGARAFAAIAIATDTDELVSPCGLCRQTMAEFAPDLTVVLSAREGRRETLALGELLPRSFGPGEVQRATTPSPDP